MDKNQKRKMAGGAVYVFCAFMLMSILVIAIMTAVGDRREGTRIPAVTQWPDVTDNGTARVTEPAETAGTSEPNTEKPADTAASGDPKDAVYNGTEPVNEASAVPYSYYMPINGYISRGFSVELAVWSPTMNDYRAHCGIDIEAPRGTAVAAFADGVVTAIYRDQFMGCCLCVEHSGGMKSYYKNLSGEFPASITEGATVTCGQTVGTVGESAVLEASDPSHLHFEVTVNGKQVDPLEYLDYDPISAQVYEDGE